MRHKLIYYTLILALTAVIGGCNSADTANIQKPAPNVPQTQNTHPDGARRVTIDELVAMMKEGKAYVVDVRNQAAYDQGHIPGSHLIPYNEILNRVSELPSDKLIVTYCS